VDTMKSDAPKPGRKPYSEDLWQSSPHHPIKTQVPGTWITAREE
jgi:hypothetical protein